MRVVVYLFSGLLIQLMPAPPSRAQEVLRLEEVVREALAANPELKAANEHWQAARHRVPQASALPDPTVGYMVMGPRFIETRTGPQDQVYEAEQMVPFPGKLWERRRMAAAEAKAAEAQLKATERDVIMKVTEAYANLSATDASILAVEEVQYYLNSFEAITQARYGAQGGSQRDVAKAQVEASETAQRLLMLRQQREATAALLNALLDRDPQRPVGQVAAPEIPAPAWTLDELLAFAKQHRPELREAEAQLKRDRHAKTLAAFEYVPDVSVGFQYVKIGSGMTTDPDDGRDAWMVPLMINIPLWQNRLVPAQREARRNVNASQAKLEQAENLSEYEVRDAYYRFTATREVAALYEHAVLPEAEVAFRSDQASYEAGRTDALNLLDSERVYLNAKVMSYEAVAEAAKSFAALERAVGTDLTTREGTTP